MKLDPIQKILMSKLMIDVKTFVNAKIEKNNHGLGKLK